MKMKLNDQEATLLLLLGERAKLSKNENPIFTDRKAVEVVRNLDFDHVKDRPFMAFFGNKFDLVDRDLLDLSSIEAKAARIGVRLFMTSAKESIAVSDVFVPTVEQFVSDRFH
jgi:O-methyltransferase involved in polyketide biosynthesis